MEIVAFFALTEPQNVHLFKRLVNATVEDSLAASCNLIDFLKTFYNMKPRLILLTFLICNSLFSQVPDPDMALIPAGEFTMGKNTSGITDWQPEHIVSVDAFYMDKFEVTNKL
jgi:formylglycine-generating enzyme required for sulfatase activity